MMATSIVSGYRTICILAWMYGFGMGAYRYSLKMFALERVRARYFTRAWGKLDSRNTEFINIYVMTLSTPARNIFYFSRKRTRRKKSNIFSCQHFAESYY